MNDPLATPKSSSIEVFTIGHSNLTMEDFVTILRRAGITAVVDVRSVPFSSRAPQYNRRILEAALKEQGIDYRFFGKALGGRPSNPKLYVGGTADYEAMAKTDQFKIGVDRVLKGAHKHRLALMCSEQDPIECHRCLLVGRALAGLGSAVTHILPDASFQSQQDIERRLLKLNQQSNRDFFVPNEEQLEQAYRDQGMRVAFTERTLAEPRWEASDVDYR